MAILRPVTVMLIASTSLIVANKKQPSERRRAQGRLAAFGMRRCGMHGHLRPLSFSCMNRITQIGEMEKGLVK